VYASVCTAREPFRDAICEALWKHVSAQDLAEVCVYLGLAPQGEYGNLWVLKIYATRRYS
jgi:hypothetical protein